MDIKNVEFIASFPKASACPVVDKPEFAFIGRSNVGKSSLINMLCNRKSLAKVSVTPGKTQLLNFFEVDLSWFLVDLPGYGYAKTSKTLRIGFGKMIESYFKTRESLTSGFVLIDSRRDLQKIDLEFMIWCSEQNVPFSIIVTKVDKLTKSQLENNLKSIKLELGKVWEVLPNIFLTSSEKKIGREDVLEYIGECIRFQKKNN